VFRFITRQHFLVNVAAALVLLGLVLFGTMWMLGFITRHGEYERVPSVLGKSLPDAIRLLEEKGFGVEVSDSLWDEQQAPLAVLKQLPAGEEMVKAKRIIYLSINRSQPPMVEMPNLVGLSFRNAELYLRQLGLKLGDTLRKPDIAKDAVLEQLYGGAVVKPGTKLFQGSTIAFVLGSGISTNEIEIPQLIGLSFAEAKALLQGLGINVGALLVDAGVSDTAAAFVYKHNPPHVLQQQVAGMQQNKIRPGQSIDLWLSVERAEPPQVDSLELFNDQQ
jgi:beta-lactam-binding protein with PASTA domain